MQPQQLDEIVRRAMDATEAVRAAVKTEARAMLWSAEFREQIRALVRDEISEEVRDANKSPDAVAFELRYLQRELAALTKEISQINLEAKS